MTITLDSTGALRRTDEAVRNRIRCQPYGPLPRGEELWHAAGWLRGRIYELGQQHHIDPLDLRASDTASYAEQRGHKLAHRWLLFSRNEMDAAHDNGGCCDDCAGLLLTSLIGITGGITLMACRGRTDDALALWETAMVMQGLIPDPLTSAEIPQPRQIIA